MTEGGFEFRTWRKEIAAYGGTSCQKERNHLNHCGLYFTSCPLCLFSPFSALLTRPPRNFERETAPILVTFVDELDELLILGFRPRPFDEAGGKNLHPALEALHVIPTPDLGSNELPVRFLAIFHSLAQFLVLLLAPECRLAPSSGALGIVREGVVLRKGCLFADRLKPLQRFRRSVAALPAGPFGVREGGRALLLFFRIKALRDFVLDNNLLGDISTLFRRRQF